MTFWPWNNDHMNHMNQCLIHLLKPSPLGLPKPLSDSFVKIAMKWFTPLLVMSLISLTQSLRKEDTENDHLSRPDGGGDGRVSYYCASIKPQDAGSCGHVCRTQGDLYLETLPMSRELRRRVWMTCESEDKGARTCRWFRSSGCRLKLNPWNAKRWVSWRWCLVEHLLNTLLNNKSAMFSAIGEWSLKRLCIWLEGWPRSWILIGSHWQFFSSVGSSHPGARVKLAWCRIGNSTVSWFISWWRCGCLGYFCFASYVWSYGWYKLAY